MPALPDKFRALVTEILIGQPDTRADTAMQECHDWLEEKCSPEYLADLNEKGDLRLGNRVYYVSPGTDIRSVSTGELVLPPC